MAKNRRAPWTMAEGLDFLLNDICVDLGFCLPPMDNARIRAIKSWEAEAFAAEIIRVEGLNPDEHPAWRRNMRNRFIEMFGTDTINSESFEQRQKGDEE